MADERDHPRGPNNRSTRPADDVRASARPRLRSDQPGPPQDGSPQAAARGAERPLTRKELRRVEREAQARAEAERTRADTVARPTIDDPAEITPRVKRAARKPEAAAAKPSARVKPEAATVEPAARKPEAATAKPTARVKPAARKPEAAAAKSSETSSSRPRASGTAVMSRAEERAQESGGHPPRRRASSASARADEDRASGRSRHSTGLGEDFSTIVGWTTAGTFIPGSGLLRAGKRRRGLVILLGFLGGIAVIFAFLLWRGPVSFVSRLGTSPDYLLGIAVVAALGALIWILVILGTFNALRSPTILTRGQKALSGVMVTSLAIIVGVPLGVTTYYSLVQRQTIVDVFGSSTGASVGAEDLWADTARVNVMLMGQDSGAGRTGVRPDTMLVSSIVPATGDTTLISVPRNLNMPVFPEGSPLEDRFPSGFNAFGMEESLINAVWTWADSEPDVVAAPDDMAPGMWATMKAVEGSLGLELDYFAAVDMEGFEDLIDAIGGVEIDVERPIPMGGGTNMTSGLPNKINGYIDPGAQKLDGERALWYVRSREGADNYDRMCRQQKMLKLTLDQIDPQEIALAYPQLAGSASRNISTDIPQNEFGAFIELAERMRSGSVDSVQINNDVVATYNPDYDVLHAWVQEQLEAPGDDVPETAEDQDGGAVDSGDAGDASAGGGSSDTSDTSGDAAEGAASGGESADSAADAEQKTEDGVWCLPQDYSEDKVWRDYTPGGQ